LKYRGGVSFIPADAPRAYRAMRRRGRKVYTVDIVGRYETHTAIDIREAREYRFERVGSVSNRTAAAGKSRKALPQGVTGADCREVVG
jgi:hypothetical protein